jgi:hypothetical protein
MVTKPGVFALRKLRINSCSPVLMTGLLTPSTRTRKVDDVTVTVTASRDEPVTKRTCLSSPMAAHAISSLRQLVAPTPEDKDEDDEDDDEDEHNCDDDDSCNEEEVEYDDDDEEVDECDAVESTGEQLEDELLPATVNSTNLGSNVLIPEEDLSRFITENFVCKGCEYPIQERSIVTVRVGCACNVYWTCDRKDCDATASILAKQSSNEASGQFKKNRPELATYLGDYDINRQVVLACQQSGGGSRMASTFGSIMSISRPSIWNRCFTTVEELIGKREILLGETIIEQNLQDEIAVSEWDTILNKAKVTVCLDAGWDQRASGKAYNSASGRVVGVGGETKKVVALQYYSRR